LVAQAESLICAHSCPPREFKPAFQDFISDGCHTITMGEKGLVLEADVMEVMALPMALQFFADALGVQPIPAALVDMRVRAERAAKAASL